LESFCHPDENTQQPLYYDRSLEPFRIPPGYSFVVTDIIALPFCSGHFVPDGRWLGVLEGQLGGRGMTMVFRGDSTVHYSLNGGFAYTSDNVPVVRIVETPTPGIAKLEIQVLGYFVRGNAIALGAPRF
jgi:hypothetical protein